MGLDPEAKLTDRAKPRSRKRRSGLSQDAEGVLKDLVELAERFAGKVHTDLRIDANVARAVLKEADRKDIDLIVIGPVGNRIKVRIDIRLQGKGVP